MSRAYGGDFLAALRERVLVCDGAMGTVLYGRGVFLNRCFDELNLSAPSMRRGRGRCATWASWCRCLPIRSANRPPRCCGRSSTRGC